MPANYFYLLGLDKTKKHITKQVKRKKPDRIKLVSIKKSELLSEMGNLKGLFLTCNYVSFGKFHTVLILF